MSSANKPSQKPKPANTTGKRVAKQTSNKNKTDAKSDGEATADSKSRKTSKPIEDGGEKAKQESVAISIDEPIKGKKEKTQKPINHLDSKSTIAVSPRDKTSSNDKSAKSNGKVQQDTKTVTALNNNNNGAVAQTGLNNEETNKNTVQNNNNGLSQKKVPNNTEVKNNVNLNRPSNKKDSKDVKQDGGGGGTADTEKIEPDKNGNKKTALTSAKKVNNNEKSSSKILPDKTLMITDTNDKTIEKSNNDSNDKKTVNNLGALAKKKWSKISVKDLASGNTSPVTDKKSLNGVILNADNLDGSLSVPTADDRNADTKSLLSVTSGARRGSADSRRSFDFGARAGLMQATVINPPEAETEKPRSLLSNDDSYIRNAIPFLPLPMAIVCLLFNIFTPGLGTILSGISIYCCGKPRVHSKDDHKAITLCVNTSIGLCQLFTIPLCLVGWFWSIAWGILMVSLAVQHRREQRGKRERELQALALSAFATNGPAIHPLVA